MANYATYSDVEYAKYGTSGKTFSASQQTAVTDMITKAHGAIVGYIGDEPTSTDNLIDIEVEIVLNKLWNTEHPDQRPYPTLTRGLMDRLKTIKPEVGRSYSFNPRGD